MEEAVVLKWKISTKSIKYCGNIMKFIWTKAKLWLNFPEMLKKKAMFYGELAETGDSIELPDCGYQSLLDLFRYMYSDEVNLNGSNVINVLYLAKKYILPLLADKCAEYLLDNADPSNFFSILPSARKYNKKNLVDWCWKAIDEQTEEGMKSDGFATIEMSLLEAVVGRDTDDWRVKAVRPLACG